MSINKAKQGDSENVRFMDSFEDRVEAEGGDFAQAYAAAIELVKKGPKPAENSPELIIAETMYNAIRELRSADSDFYSAREKAMRDLARSDGSTPGQMIGSHAFSFPFTHGWAAQLDTASAAYNSALRHFWSVYELGQKLGMWS